MNRTSFKQRLNISDSSINMIFPVKLLSVRPLLSISLEDKFIWLYQTNIDSRRDNPLAHWTAYPSDISLALERAFKNGDDETFISTLYRIDFIELLQEDIDDPKHQVPIQRCQLKAHTENDPRTELETGRRERLSFPLNMIASSSTGMDISYHGSQFVRDWLLSFNNGKLNVKFDAIFPALINGLKFVGRDESESSVNDIVRELNSIKDQTLNKKECQKMNKLQDCCAKIYTKPSFLFRVVNTALRDDDRSKLEALGPYCYLVYNYVGRHTDQNMSLRHRLLQGIHSTDPESMIVYRGDYASRKAIEEYKETAGKVDKYFRWLPFVSTSFDRDVAEKFGRNVLYIIELQRYLSNDQFTDLDKNTYISSEKEILLKPGARFQVMKIQRDDMSGRQWIYVKIIPSYISNLK